MTEQKRAISLTWATGAALCLLLSSSCTLLDSPVVTENTETTEDQGIDASQDMPTTSADEDLGNPGSDMTPDMPALDADMDDAGTLPVDMTDDADMFVPTCDVPAELIAHDDERVQAGSTYSVTPRLSQGSIVQWSKAYGPDELSVDTETGEITWQIPSGMPVESFHVGVEGVDSCGNVVQDIWVVTVGNNTILRVGFDQNYTTIRSAFAAANPGDTIILNAGRYQGDDNDLNANGTPVAQPPSGTSNAFTTVIAADPTDVSLASALYWVGKWGDVHHIAVKGLFVDDGIGLNTATDQAARPHHIKFVDVGSSGGISISNADDVLVEGCYSFGNSRYKLSTYKANRVIFRRCVTRLDHAPLTGQETPFGSAVAYSSDDVVFQNIIDIDSDQFDAYPIGELTGAFAVPTTAGASERILYNRAIALNNATKLGSYDATNGAAEVEYRDIIAWDFDLVAGLPDLTHGFGEGTMTHMTVGNIRTEGDVAGIVNGIFNGWGGERDEVTNSFLSDISLPLFYQIEAISHNGLHNVSEYTYDGAEHRPDTFVQVDAREDVLSHLPRINAGSVLDGAASDGGVIGATVMTFAGRSGTFHGETGWDVETGVSMWPFPHEKTIAKYMGAYHYVGEIQDGRQVDVNGARGFAASGEVALDGEPQTLTTYIWEYLGTPCPADICRASRSN